MNHIATYLGDTLGGWVDGVDTSIEKSHKPAWSPHLRTNGCCWRVTARMGDPVFAGSRTLVFSTTEPRVLQRDELRWLCENLSASFMPIFDGNAKRDWVPIWCLERDGAPHAPMDMARWLRSASRDEVHPIAQAVRLS